MSGTHRGRKARPAPLSIRLNDGHRKQLTALADGLPLSSYIKAVLFRDDAAALRRPPRAVTADRQLLARVLAALGESRLASNLNQLAYAANSGSLFCDDQIAARLTEACSEVSAIRVLLMQALGKCVALQEKQPAVPGCMTNTIGGEGGPC